MNLKGERVLVTGGCGFIGSHLVEKLLGEGVSVTVLDDLSTGNEENLAAVRSDVDLRHGSILDEQALEKAAKGCAGVFHMAAVVSVPRSVEEPVFVHQVNTLGTLNVLESARKHGLKVVFSSSAAVYGDSPELPKKEDQATVPISPYGIQKLMGEYYLRNYCHLHGLAGVSLRYFNVFGPRQDPKSPYSGVITLFCKRASQGEALTIFGDGTQTRDFVYVGDVVEANFLAMQADGGEGESLNVGTGLAVSLNELAALIQKLYRNDQGVKYLPARPGDIMHSLSDISRTRSKVGFYPNTPLEKGLASTISGRF